MYKILMIERGEILCTFWNLSYLKDTEGVIFFKELYVTSGDSFLSRRR